MGIKNESDLPSITETKIDQMQFNTTHTLIIGDALKALQDEEVIPTSSIDLMVTSPPYGLEKNYGDTYTDKFNLDNWIEMMEKVANFSYRILKENGSFFLNVSPIPSNKTKEIVPLDVYSFLAFKKYDYYLRNKIIWHFNNMQNCVQRLSGRWEAILWFVKDLDNYTFNLKDIKIPCITKNDKRFDANKGRNPTDVWYFDRTNNMTKNKFKIKHPCVYPEKMIERILKMSSNPGDMILDPFVGSGTTMRVAKLLQRNSIGIEINPDYENDIKRRIEPGISTIFGGKCTYKVVHYE